MKKPVDPFSFKHLPRWSVRRMTWTGLARLHEAFAATRFESMAIPLKPAVDLVERAECITGDTAVTRLQLSYLLSCLKATESFAPYVVVEVGSYRGATTLSLASSTSRTVFAVDPYSGYGAAEYDYNIFKDRVDGVGNIKHLRATSGAAARAWNFGPVGFVFIDAVHDYVNTSFDISVWAEKLVPGGLMALHDTDNPAFPGTRKAAYMALKKMDLWAHTKDLVVLRRRSGLD